MKQEKLIQVKDNNSSFSPCNQKGLESILASIPLFQARPITLQQAPQNNNSSNSNTNNNSSNNSKKD